MAKKRKRKRRSPAPKGAAQQGAERSLSSPPEGVATRRPRTRSGGAGDGLGPPPPPWGSFPLSELVVLVAVIFLLGGFFIGPPQGPVMLGAGLVLGSLAGLELAVREHFAGYRSHTLLIAGFGGIAVLFLAVLVAGLSPLLGAIAGAVVFGLLTWPLANAFRNRSGGALFKVRLWRDR